MMSDPLRSTRAPALAAAALVVAGPAAAAAQQDDGWNGERAVELIERAIERRASPRADSGLASFSARANGYIYFYLDRTDTDERTLVKTDQVALELFWREPGLTKQRIIGRRDVDRLPNRMYYHLDHLTVVMDEFGDVIRMGEGDEVRAVPHPAARGADAFYDYRLADSLTLRFPDGREPVRVLRLEVRPRRFDRPGIIGSLFIDRATAEVVRMAFTFTPASYVDRRLDYIRVSLDNGLWDGRHWLPHEQRVEIRRQVPQLDFPAGAVIRGVFRIDDYTLDPALPEAFFRGPSITAAPASRREAYEFERGLYAGLEAEGLEPAPRLAEVRERARAIVREQYLSGLPRLRLHMSGASSAVRYNRAEGLFLGAGATYAVTNSTTLDLSAGRAFAARHWSVAAELEHGVGDATSVAGRLFREALRDLGPRAGAAGAVNTLHAALAGEDFLDPYFSSGAELRVEHRLARRWRVAARLALARHRSAQLAVRSAGGAAVFDRPVRAIADGTLLSVRTSIARSPAPTHDRDWAAELSLDAGRHDGRAYVRPVVEAAAVARTDDGRIVVRLDLAAGAGFGGVPVQRLFLLGGRATMPGHAYRGFVGDRFGLIGLAASHRIIGPWVRLRLIAAAGWTALADAIAPAAWDVRPTDGPLASAGFGLGLVHGILRVDAVRGLDGGEWELIISVDPELWDIL